MKITQILSSSLTYISHAILSFFIFIYIILEGFFWLWLTKPLFKAISSLGYFRGIAIDLKRLNPYVALVMFIFLILIDDIFIVNSAIQLSRGNIIVGFGLYGIKILIDIVTIWFFSETKEALMKFRILKWLIDKISNGLDKIRLHKMYIRTKARIRKMKYNIKNSLLTVRKKYFSRKGVILEKIKSTYVYIKEGLANLYRTKKYLVHTFLLLLIFVVYFSVENIILK